MSAPAFTLYGRKWCHLCDDMLAALEAWRPARDFSVTVVDVDSDPALEAKYDEIVPVLALGDRELCRYRFDAAAVAAVFPAELTLVDEYGVSRQTVRQALRSLLFYVVFYVQTAVLAIIVGISAVIWGRTRFGWWLVLYWIHSNLFFLRWLAGIRTDVQGEENSGYVTPRFLRGVLSGVRGIDLAQALKDERSPTIRDDLAAVHSLMSRYAVT